jgi:hypothetical protein
MPQGKRSAKSELGVTETKGTGQREVGARDKEGFL